MDDLMKNVKTVPKNAEDALEILNKYTIEFLLILHKNPQDQSNLCKVIEIIEFICNVFYMLPLIKLL